MRLYDRKALLVVDTVSNAIVLPAGAGLVPALSVPCGNDGFDIRFDIRKNLTSKPNRATIEVFNLSQEHRDGLEARAAKGPVRVRLDAGYKDGMSRIFEGDLRILYHERTGPDYITKIESGDGDRIVVKQRLSKSWAPGTPVQTVIRDLATALEIGEGNVKQSTVGAQLEGLGPTFPGGTAVSGQVVRALSRLCKSSGLEWSIQDGVLQFLVTDKALSGLAIKVTGDTGMEDTVKIDHKHRLHVKTRMIPGIFPGRKIQLEDKSVWRVDQARYHGETRGNAWNIVIEGRQEK